MGNIYGKFADQNDIVTTGQIISSNNNQSALNVALAEANHLRATTAALQPDALTITPGNLVPSVTNTLTNTISAALSGQGQVGTASEEEGGGGIPCFCGLTQITLPSGVKPIRDVALGEMVLGFNEAGKLISQKVIGRHEHLEKEYFEIEFADGEITGTTPKHKYWTRSGYEEVANLEYVWHWKDGWIMRKIVGKQFIKGEVILYNLTTDGHHNYIANNDAVSNLKPEG